METKVKGEWWEESCRLFVLPVFLFYSTFPSFLSSNSLPTCPLPIILLWLFTHINFLPNFDLSFLPFFIHLLSTSLSTIIISLYLSSHWCYGYTPSKQRPIWMHSNRYNGSTCARLWWNPARWKIPRTFRQLIDTQESCFLLVANVTGDGMLQSAQEETQTLQRRQQNRRLPVTEVVYLQRHLALITPKNTGAPLSVRNATRPHSMPRLMGMPLFASSPYALQCYFTESNVRESITVQLFLAFWIQFPHLLWCQLIARRRIYLSFQTSRVFI